MEKVTINKIYTTDKDKQGNPLISKQGKPYTRLSIKTNEHGDKWISGFKNAVSGTWKEGDEVEITITQKGEYLNFDTPKKDDKVVEMLSQLLTKVGKIDAKMDMIAESVGVRDYMAKKSGTVNSYPEEEISLEDMPF